MEGIAILPVRRMGNYRASIRLQVCLLVPTQAPHHFLVNNLFHAVVPPNRTKPGFTLEALLDSERDAVLSNSGLGRLAICRIDSSATCEIPVGGLLEVSSSTFQQPIGLDGSRC